MKKNLMIAMLFVSILMISVVSAGITGYLVSRGGGIAEAGYTATLQQVEGNTAIISVQTPSGNVEVVNVPSGGTATVEGAEISVSSLTRGNFLKRSSAKIELRTATDDVVAGIATNNAFSQSSINANSCDADSVCEIAKTLSTSIGSSSALILTAKKYSIDVV